MRSHYLRSGSVTAGKEPAAHGEPSGTSPSLEADLAFAEELAEGDRSTNPGARRRGAFSGDDVRAFPTHEVFARLGTPPDMGLRLPETFAQAGLEPSPDLDAETAIAVGEDAITRWVEVARSLLPAIIDTGVATEAQIDIDTLAERLRAGTGPAGPGQRLAHRDRRFRHQAVRSITVSQANLELLAQGFSGWGRTHRASSASCSRPTASWSFPTRSPTAASFAAPRA